MSGKLIFYYHTLNEIYFNTNIFRMNRLDSLPRGFGAFAVLEVLDLTYNNLNESSLPGNFFMLGKYNHYKTRYLYI